MLYGDGHDDIRCCMVMDMMTNDTTGDGHDDKRYPGAIKSQVQNWAGRLIVRISRVRVRFKDRAHTAARYAVALPVPAAPRHSQQAPPQPGPST